MPLLSVIVPTFNERENVAPLVASLATVLTGVDYEIVVVDDDSPDGTGTTTRGIAQRDPRVRVLRRIGRRGLSSAVIEGMLSASSPYLAVIDADGQHDETILPEMLRKLRDEQLELVVASRHLEGGGMDALSGERLALSNAGRRLFSLVGSGQVTDPMSGYFLLTRDFFDEVAHGLSGIGFKVLVDILATARRPVMIGEVGYRFRPRERGESKLDIVVELEFLELLFDKVTGGWIPPSYFLFGLVGAVGMAFNFAATAILLLGFDFDCSAGLQVCPGFIQAQAIGALLTVAVNFLLNNVITFRTRQMRGTRWLLGLVRFYLVCSIGLLAQLAVATALQRLGAHWVPSTLVGILIGSVWNYTIAANLVWISRRR